MGYGDPRGTTVKRRRFLQTTIFIACVPTIKAGSPTSTRSAEIAALTDGQWQQLAAIQAHLFPREPHAPGALDINALSYLRSVLADDPGLRRELVPLLVNGLERLRQLSSAAGYSEFTTLDETPKETLLRQLEREPDGHRFLHALLHYILEACLTDPIYGGNPDGIGWRWLGFQAGYKRPTEEKRYFLLSGIE
uniref:Gluconate 2-dehydrogenase gamma chain n=1 Tax=Candidatus Kentrum sp. FW TaxID=2126338 RepID=A0A450RUG1_9GAMM|nr:MAG: gluconate 2-dehydrogenase gamma chain [Candidatus Kentron sp. FW]